MEVELHLTKKELEYIYFAIENYTPLDGIENLPVEEQFGTWMLHGLKFLTKEDFFGDFAFYIPPMMIKLSNEPCYKTFYTRVHYNFS